MDSNNPNDPVQGNQNQPADQGGMGSNQTGMPTEAPAGPSTPTAVEETPAAEVPAETPAQEGGEEAPSTTGGDQNPAGGNTSAV